MNLHELKIWFEGFAAALEKTGGNSGISKDQWEMIKKIVRASGDPKDRVPGLLTETKAK